MSNVWNWAMESAYILPAPDLVSQAQAFGLHNVYENAKVQEAFGKVGKILSENFQITIGIPGTWTLVWQSLLDLPQIPPAFTDRKQASLLARTFQRHLVLDKTLDGDNIAVYYWEGRACNYFEGLIAWNLTKQIASIYLEERTYATESDDDVDFVTTITITIPSPDLAARSWQTASSKIQLTAAGESHLNREILTLVMCQNAYLHIVEVRARTIRAFREHCDKILLRDRASKFRTEIAAMRLPLSVEDFELLLRAQGIPETQRMTLLDQWRQHDWSDIKSFPRIERPRGTLTATANLDAAHPWQEWHVTKPDTSGATEFQEYLAMISLFDKKETNQEGDEMDERVDIDMAKSCIDHALAICHQLNQIDEEEILSRDR